MIKTIRYSLDKGAFPLVTAHEADAGYDIRTPQRLQLVGKYQRNIPTGVHIEIPKGYYAKVESKSGLMTKYGIVACGGVIDSGYSGEIVITLRNNTYFDYTFEAGDKIAQLIIHKHEKPELELVKSIDGGERGEDGFGSSGR